jgi:hypothetical protein
MNMTGTEESVSCKKRGAIYQTLFRSQNQQDVRSETKPVSN